MKVLEDLRLELDSRRRTVLNLQGVGGAFGALRPACRTARWP